jgi:hypothetical protein
VTFLSCCPGRFGKPGISGTLKMAATRITAIQINDCRFISLNKELRKFFLLYATYNYNTSNSRIFIVLKNVIKSH